MGGCFSANPKSRELDEQPGPSDEEVDTKPSAFIAKIHETRVVNLKGHDAEDDAFIASVHATRADVDLKSRQTCVDEEQPEYVSTKVRTSKKYGADADADADAFIARVHATRAAVDLKSRQTCVAGHDCFSASPNGRDEEHPKDVLEKDRPIDEESGCDVDTRAGAFIAKVKDTRARRLQEP